MLLHSHQDVQDLEEMFLSIEFLAKSIFFSFFLIHMFLYR